MSNPSELVRAWGVSVGRYVAAGVLGFTWTLTVTRSTSTSDAGMVLLIGSLPGLMGPLLDVGLPSAIAFHIAGESADRHIVTRWVLTATSALSAIAVVVTAIGVGLLVLTRGPTALVVLGVAAVIFSICLGLVAGQYRGFRSFRSHATLTISPYVFLALSTVIVVGLGHASADTIVPLIVTSYGLPCLIWLARGLPFDHLPIQAALAYFRQATAYSWRIYVSEAAAAIRGRIDILVVTILISTSAAAVLGTASMVAANLALAAQAAHLVVFPFVAESSARGLRSAAETELASRLALVATVLACAAAIAVGPAGFAAIFGPEFERSWQILLAYVPAIIVLSTSRIVTSDLMARGAVSEVMRISVWSTAIGLALLVTGIVLAGPIGAGVAASLTAVINTTWRVLTLRQRSDLHIAALLIPKRTDIQVVRSLYERKG